MITDEEAEAAQEALRDTAQKAAAARRERVRAELYRKSLKALLMRESNLKTVSERETYAYAHERYIAHIEKIAAAAFEDMLMQAEREGHSATIQAWQTQSANLRQRI